MAVGREFRLRVRRALDANGIEIGIPQYYSLEASMKLGNRSKPEWSNDADIDGYLWSQQE